MFDETIAAISTAPVAAGIALIRISGSHAIQIADKVFTAYRGTRVSEMDGYSCAYGYIRDNLNNKIDDAVLTVFKNPHSYTGEDIVEISCHGGVYVSKKILRLILKNGAVPAQPGEFTKRAFLNQKMDLTKSESVIDIISASSQKSARLAQNAYSGKLFKKIKGVTDDMSELCSHLQAWADYPDEEIETIDNDRLLKGLLRIREKLSELTKNYDNGKIIRDGINTAIIGKANVGKSTFMNRLAGFDRSIVTDIPGTTRDTVEERIAVDDLVLNLCDTAGIRDTEDIVEKIGVKRALDKISQADLILAIFDYSTEITDKDMLVIKNTKDIPTVAIINKTDLSQRLDCDYIEKAFDRVVYISAQNEVGFEDFNNALHSVFDLSFAENADAVMLNERQNQAVLCALINIDNAIDTLTFGFTFDAVTVCIEDAMDKLLELTGEKVSDVIIDKIFSRFCVGK